MGRGSKPPPTGTELWLITYFQKSINLSLKFPGVFESWSVFNPLTV